MRDISKRLTVINTEKKDNASDSKGQSSGVTYVGFGGGGVRNLNDYLLKSIWDRVWEIRTDSQGTEYIFGKLPVVTQYGITMYSGENVDIPTIAEGLPFDNRTIWLNPTTGQIEVIGGTGGGGSGEGVSNFWDLSGIPLWITNTKPTYSYSEIKNTPDLSVYALKSAIPSLDGYAKLSDIPSLSGYATEQWVLGKGYAISSDLSKYIPIAGVTDITGEKNFTGGLKVNGSPIYYDTEKKYWKLEGDLLVTGGVTMYGNDTAFTPSTIMDAILYDDSTLGINEQGQLYVKGGTGGGIADSIAWGNVSGKPSWITDSAPIISISGVNVSLGGGISQSSLRTALGLGSNAYSSTAYLPLSGGVLSSDTSAYPLLINSNYNTVETSLMFRNNGTNKSSYGWYSGIGTYMSNVASGLIIGITDAGVAHINNNTILHQGNYSSYALPLSGGTLTSTDVPLTLKRTNAEASSLRFFIDDTEYGAVGFYKPKGFALYLKAKSSWYNIWHEDNDGSGSGLDADLLDGVHLMGKEGLSGIIMSWSRASFSTINQYFGNGNIVVFDPLPTDASSWDLGANTVIVSYGDNSARNHQLAYSIYENYNPKYRRNVDGTWSEWKTFAFTSDNVASATKLKTARTIWGQSFDGTGNVDGQLVINSSTTYPIRIIQNYSSAWASAFLATNSSLTAGQHYNIDFGHSTSAYNAAWVGYYHAGVGSTSNRLSMGLNSVDDVINILATGNVGIGTTNPTQKLHVVGNILATGGITMYSARKLKNITDERGLSLEELSVIKPTRFTWKDGRDNKIHIGGIADDVMKVLPEVIYKTGEDGTLTMDYGNAAFAISASLIKPVITHEEEIKALKNRIKELEEQVKTLSWNIA